MGDTVEGLPVLERLLLPPPCGPCRSRFFARTSNPSGHFNRHRHSAEARSTRSSPFGG